MIYQRVDDILFISLVSRLIGYQADNPADMALPDISPLIFLLYLRILEARASVALVFNQANPHRQHSCRTPAAPRGMPRALRARAYPVSRTRSEFALRWCAGSFGQAHILNTNKRSTCIAMQALEAGQVRLACPHLAPTPDLLWHLCGWVGGGGLAGCGPCSHACVCASPGWRLQFAARPPAARRACFGRATALTDDALRARVPLAPLCPASVVGLAWPTPNNRRLTQVS